MKDNKSASLFQKEQVMESLKQSFVKLNPRVMIKNPIMFTVEVVTVVIGLRYPTAPGRQYFLSTQADSGDYFFLTGEITPGKVTFLDFGYQHLPLYVEKQHYRVVKENDNYYILSDQKESLQNRYVQYMRRIYSLDSAYNQLCRGYDTISDIGRKAKLSDRLKKDLPCGMTGLFRG